MTTHQGEIWHGAKFNLERSEGSIPGTVIFHLSGPLTMRDMYAVQTPNAFREMLDLQTALPSGAPPKLHIFDMSGVPYMDSMGLGWVASHFARCQARGVRMIAAGVGPRVMEVFRLTKVDTIVPIAATIEEACSN